MNTLALPADNHTAVFSLASGADLLGRICDQLAIAPGSHEEREFEDGEHKIRPLESVRGRDVYVVVSLYGDNALSVDGKLTRMLFFLAALRDAGAHRVTAVTPYLCYARKDVRSKARDPVTLRYVAQLFESVGIDRLVAVDIHNPAAFQNAFRVPTEHLTAAPVLISGLVRALGDESAVVLSPDAGGIKRAERFRHGLQRRIGHAVGFAFMDKFRSEGIVRAGSIVGEVKGRIVVIVDDLISSGTTLAHAAAACRERGAATIYAVATHGVFSAEASRVLAASAIDRTIVTNTISSHRLDRDLVGKRIEVVDCAPLLASAIHRLHANGSLVELTEPVGM